MASVGDRIIARIVDLTPEWEGVGLFGAVGTKEAHDVADSVVMEKSQSPQNDGEMVRVPGVWPGDIVECALLARSRHHGHWFGRAMRVVAHGVTREKGVCPVQAACGGCAALTIPYEAQVAQKWARLEALFPGAGFVAAPQPLRYRNKVKWIVGPGSDGRPTVGFYRHDSHRFLPVSDCAVLVLALARLARQLPEVIADVPPYNEADQTGLLRAILAKCTSSGEMLVTFVVAARPDTDMVDRLSAAGTLEGVAGVTCNLHPDTGNRLTGHEEWTLVGADSVRENDHSAAYLVNATCFSQAHHSMARAAVDNIVRALHPVTEPVLDLFCGVGPIALALAADGHAVTGVELESRAIELARQADPSLSWITADVNRIEALPTPAGDFALVVNPPRQGLSADLLSWIEAQPIRTLAYMSCNPQTLARDAARLTAGSFILDTATGYDMFPQTPWFETVALFFRQVNS
ncbi:MAG: hypothetical protein CVU65_01555 [Deltaproteobacteria bacterium HGW-Deltaproteobacteria-22]|jgi:23S rRNA (uracil1939-C5)-methyltransferase|nr:MAG: hypothetical protein CVU65_01555 [Deltaproteobacteria bacterium HGW-Deltaproteobacteria-22]